MEIYLSYWINPDGTFKVYNRISLPDVIEGSVFICDYKDTPWPRKDGNLLWS